MAGLRNKRPDLNGVLVVDKPLGMTSAQVCAAVRRMTGGAKVGHAGTLDPLASGVLVLCLGRATKRIDSIMAGVKEYEATIDLSAFSTTDDLEGEAVAVAVGAPPSRDELERALKAFEGEILQRPPVYSAVHVDGERAYKAARRAERAGDAPPERPDARAVLVHEIRLVSFDWPAADVAVVCGKGVYIRSLARDLGESLGTGGRLTALRRTRVGYYTLADAVTIEECERRARAGDMGLREGSEDGATGSSSASL